MQTKTMRITASIALIASFAFSSTFLACKSPLLNVVLEEVAVAVTAPVISAVYPSVSASEVPVNAELSITFSKNINAATVNSSTMPIKDAQGTAVTGRYSVQAATVTFAATGGFGFGQSYTVTITAGVLDTDGNPLSEEKTWVFTTSLTPDTTAPTLTSLTFNSTDIVTVDSAKWAGSLTVDVTVSASDDRAISQVLLSENPSLAGATWVTYNSAAPVYALTFSAPGGLKHIYGQVKDGAGNISSISTSEDVYIDVTEPVVSNVLINGGASATNTDTVTLDIFSADEGASSGLTQFRHRISGGEWSAWVNLTTESGTGTARGSVVSVTITAGLGELATLEAQVMDATNHLSAVFQRSILYEQTPPTVVDVSWDNLAVFPYNGSLLRITFDEEMNPDSFSETSFTLEKSSDETPVPGMINLTTGNTAQNAMVELWGLILAPNTSYKIKLATTVEDIAGNALGGSEKIWFFSTGDAVDSNPPTGTVTVNDQADPIIVVPLPSGASATNSTSLELDFSEITDDYNIPYGIKIWGDNSGSAAFFEQNAQWVAWSDTVTWTLSPGSGTKYVLYKLMDSASNESASAHQLKIILDDGVAPILSSVIIDSGNTHTNSTDRLVDIIIQAEDIHSGIKEMMISNLADFSDAEWEDWRPVISDWALSDPDGLKTVYVTVRDYLDQSPITAATDSIILDRINPEVSFNRPEILINTDTQLLEGSAGTDLYRITDASEMDSWSWEQMSGPGIVYFNLATGGGTANDGTHVSEPWIRATTEGDYFIKATVTDKAGNVGEATVPFRWDVTPPGNIANLTRESYYDTTGQPTWRWDAVSDADFYRISYEADFDPYIDVYSTSFTPNSPLIPDGVKTLYVRAQDNAGNYSTALNAPVHVDTTPPTITISNGNFVIVNIEDSNILIDGIVSDGDSDQSGIKTYQWAKISGSGTLDFDPQGGASTTISASATPTASADDTYLVQLQVTDYAGNISEAYINLLWDRTVPSAPTVTGPDITPSRYPTWYWSSGGGGIGEYRYQLDGGSTEYTSSTSFTGTALSDAADHTLLVYEKDAAENWSLAGSKTVHVDTTALTPPILSIGDGQPQLRTITSMTWNLFTGAGGTANAYRWQIDGTPGTNWTVVPTGLPEPPATAATVNPSSLSEGTHTLYVQERIDADWQEGKQASHSIIVDTIAPTIPVLMGTGLSTTTEDRTATPDATPTWTWTPGGGGNGKYRYKLSRLYTADGTSSVEVILDWSAETTITSYTATAQSDGTYRFEVQERDDAGNLSSIRSQLTTIDTVYPVLTGVLVRGTSHPSDSDYTYTRSATVNVDITADISGDFNHAYNRDVQINIWDYNPAAWENHSVYPEASSENSRTISTTFTTTNGTQYVYVRLIDEAGNTTSYIYDTIILDTVAPAGTFAVNNGAATTPSSSFYLTLTASDNISSASEIEVQDSTDFTAGDYRTYASSMLSDILLYPAAGNQKAYVQFRDGAGNVSASYSDTIILEVPVPTYAVKGQYSGGYTYVYYSPVTDPAGGTYTTRYNIYSTTNASANPNNGDPVTYLYNTTSTSYSYAPIPKGELHYFFVRAYDTDTGGYGPYSATKVLGFSSNITVLYDQGDATDQILADKIKAVLENTIIPGRSIVDGTTIKGTMPAWSVTLLPEDLVSNTLYNTNTMIYGDPVIVTHGATMADRAATYDIRIRNLVAHGRGVMGIGYGNVAIDRVNANWVAWALGGTQPSSIGYLNTATLTSATSAKFRPASSSESIWWSPIYNNYIDTAMGRETSVTANVFTQTTGRYGVILPAGTPTDWFAYAGDASTTNYYPVVRQGKFLTYGFFDVTRSTTSTTTTYEYGLPFFVNLVARMASY